jgi:hypothetical protein
MVKAEFEFESDGQRATRARLAWAVLGTLFARTILAVSPASGTPFVGDWSTRSVLLAPSPGGARPLKQC